MKKVSIFIKRNKLIFIFFVLSTIIIVSYIVTINLPELFLGVEHWYNLLFQLSIGYIINFIFYITQIYIPNNKRDLTVRKCIYARLNKIINDMKYEFSSLAKVYIPDHKGDIYTEEELNQLLQLKAFDKLEILNARLTTYTNNVFFKVGEWILGQIGKIENQIDIVYKYYIGYISEDLMSLFEEILNSEYHQNLRLLLSTPQNSNLTNSKSTMFTDYYHLMCELKKIAENEYK